MGCLLSHLTSYAPFFLLPPLPIVLAVATVTSLSLSLSPCLSPGLLFYLTSLFSPPYANPHDPSESLGHCWETDSSKLVRFIFPSTEGKQEDEKVEGWYKK